MTDKTAGDLSDATLAAAFVAGAIDPDTRAAAALRVARDPAFAALVASMQAQLAGHDTTPPPGLWRAIAARVAKPER